MGGPNHTLNLVFAILVTIFCCLPLGIVAIVFSAIGMSRQSSGDFAGTASASRVARICIIISAGISVFLWVGYLMMLLLGFGFLGLLPFLAA